jgi:hypothetical protein
MFHKTMFLVRMQEEQCKQNLSNNSIRSRNNMFACSRLGFDNILRTKILSRKAVLLMMAVALAVALLAVASPAG